MSKSEADLLPHHIQQELCTTRLPYRQGRKLTAVKVYTINDESKHLLIFGVPSLNLRQETKSMFLRFGKVLQFSVTTIPSEQFTETYHAVFDRIESARLAKKMLDMKNYYGGNLHICYAPEFESVEETREKIVLRQRHVFARLKNLRKETESKNKELIGNIPGVIDVGNDTKSKPLSIQDSNKVNMGFVNHIILGKRKAKDLTKAKKPKLTANEHSNVPEKDEKNSIDSTITKLQKDSGSIEVVDLTSTSSDVVTNIDLNFDKFGSEIVKQVPYKPLNKIKFNYNK